MKGVSVAVDHFIFLAITDGWCHDSYFLNVLGTFQINIVSHLEDIVFCLFDEKYRIQYLKFTLMLSDTVLFKLKVIPWIPLYCL